jgi:predicted transcriptional regulator
VSTIAAEIRRDKATVIRAIQELRESGWWLIERTGPPARGGRTNTYSPNPDAPDAFEVICEAS